MLASYFFGRFKTVPWVSGNAYIDPLPGNSEALLSIARCIYNMSHLLSD